MNKDVPIILVPAIHWPLVYKWPRFCYSFRWGGTKCQTHKNMEEEQEVGAKQRQTERVADNDDLTRNIILSSLVHQHKVRKGK